MTRGEGDVSRPTPSGASGGVCGEPAVVVVNRQGHHMVHRDPVSSSTRSCTPLPTGGGRGSDRN